MRLDFIPNVNEHGESVVRLFQFKKEDCIKLCEVIKEKLIEDGKSIDVDTLDFVEPRNCGLTLRLSFDDEGITQEDKVTFYCDLTEETYEKILQKLAPFCLKNLRTHEYLYDLDTPIDFLVSPAGTW